MRISDWSSDVCSSDLIGFDHHARVWPQQDETAIGEAQIHVAVAGCADKLAAEYGIVLVQFADRSAIGGQRAAATGQQHHMPGCSRIFWCCRCRDAGYGGQNRAAEMANQEDSFFVLCVSRAVLKVTGSFPKQRRG